MPNIISMLIANDPLGNHESVDNLVMHTRTVAENTTSHFLSDQWCLFGVLSLLISLCTIYAIVAEFRNDRIDQKCQYNLLVDIIRHLYRNKVCTMAMRVKYMVISEQSDGKIVYPSEEHYLKLQLLPSDIHLEQYYKDDKKFQELHNIDLLLRNYNIEVETALMHIKNPEIGQSVKFHDFDTLNFKTGFITSKIIEVMLKIKIKGMDKNMREHAEEIIRRKQQTNIADNKQFDPKQIAQYQAAIDALFADSLANDQYITRIFDTPEDRRAFVEALKRDVEIECGFSQSGGEKVNMIVLS